MGAAPRYAGIDVGGRTKGFDIAIVDGRGRLLESARRVLSPEDAWDFAAPFAPGVIAIDSPRRPAPDGQHLRTGELLLRASVCGIRWTPDRTRIEQGGDYYDWIRRGLALDELLARRTNAAVVEVFPTASWTRWSGARGGRRRSAWSRAALGGLGVVGVPPRTSQDLRDAIAAAVTACQWARGDETETFGEIVVPLPRRGAVFAA
jgi:predicted nuclease with RNAse H fold